MKPIEFIIYGEQRPQGSKISHAIYRNGKPIMTATGRVLTVTREDNPHTKAWRQEIASVAQEAYRGPIILGAVALRIQFIRPRPQSHFGSGKNARVVKASAPAFPMTKPDSTKLLRAVEDALNNVVWRDDSQVVDTEVTKRFGERYETHVTIEALEDEDA